MQVVQIIPPHTGDNHVADEAAVLHHFFSTWGWQSSIHAGDRISPTLGIGKAGLLLYHFYLAAPIVELLAHPPERTVVVLHELIPAKPLDHFEPAFMDRLVRVRPQLEKLAVGCPLAIAHCAPACDELQNLGFKRIRQLPTVVDFEKLQRPTDRFTDAMLDSPKPKLLYIGDLHPTSGIEHFIKTAWYYRSFLAPDDPLQLVIVGNTTICPGYFAVLSEIVADLELSPEDLVFTGPLSSARLRSYFRRADLYLQLSGSDCSGARLLQAIHSDLPVVALARGAAPEILADAGILLDSTIHSAAAEALHRLRTDGEWRSLVLERQRRRLEHFSHRSVSFQLKSLLERFG